MTDSEESRGGAETKPDSESPRERDVEMREAPPRSERTESYKVFVGGIPWQLDDYKLKDCEHFRGGSKGLFRQLFSTILRAS